MEEHQRNYLIELYTFCVLKELCSMSMCAPCHTYGLDDTVDDDGDYDHR